MKPQRLEIAVLTIFVAVVGYQLFLPPIIGIADNGDFIRLLLPAGLRQIPTEFFDNYFHFFNSEYHIVARPTDYDGFKSSSVLLVRAARWINIRLFSEVVFDVRVLGALHLFLFLVGVYLVLVSSRR